MCFVAIANTLHDAYSFGNSLDHRGRDASGIVASGKNGITVIKWRGSLDRFGNKALQNLLPRHQFNTFGVHGRYKTRGEESVSLEEAHPHFIGGTVTEKKKDFMIVEGCDAALIHNGQFEVGQLTGLDRSKLKTACDSEAGLQFIHNFGIEQLVRQIPGSFSLAYFDKRIPGAHFARDMFGFMPAYIGKKDGLYTVASESRAYRDAGAIFMGDLLPGHVATLYEDGRLHDKKIVIDPVNPGHCFFQWNYFANPHSLMSRVHVMVIRQDLGEKLAEEYPFDADYVLDIPNSPQDSGRAYAAARGIEFLNAFYKVVPDRSFLQADKAARANSIKNNLHLFPEIKPLLRGKNVVVLDDSIIRANVAKRAQQLLYEEAGVKEARLLSYTPPIGILDVDGMPRGCTRGVDMNPVETEDNQFVARGRTREQISQVIGMPVYYISAKGLYEVFERRGMPREHLCAACIGGRDPIREYQKLTIGRTG